jgi:hypothetical protein
MDTRARAFQIDSLAGARGRGKVVPQAAFFTFQIASIEKEPLALKNRYSLAG